MTWDWHFTGKIIPDMLGGLLITIEVTLLASALAMALGLVWTLIRHAHVPVVSPLTTFVVHFIRGTPLLVQAFFAFYVLPNYGLRYSALVTGVIVLGVNYSAYTSEVYRGGILIVPRGQWEAALALSLSVRRRWQSVILPQAIRVSLPALGNYVVAAFKDSAILSAITVNELLNRGLVIGSNYYRYLEPLTIAGVLYLVVSYPAALLIRRLEARLAFSH